MLNTELKRNLAVRTLAKIDKFGQIRQIRNISFRKTLKQALFDFFLENHWQ